MKGVWLDLKKLGESKGGQEEEPKRWPRWKIAEEGHWAHGTFLTCKRWDLPSRGEEGSIGFEDIVLEIFIQEQGTY